MRTLVSAVVVLAGLAAVCYGLLLLVSAGICENACPSNEQVSLRWALLVVGILASTAGVVFLRRKP